MTETYTNRHVDDLVVSNVTMGKDGWVTIESPGSGFGFVPDEGKPSIVIGDVIQLETVNGSRVAGVMLNHEWLMRKSDEQLVEEQRGWAAQFRLRNIATLAANRESWTQRTAALPDWIRVRLDNFHARGGENFEIEGWGYELLIAELAVLYAESDGEESGDIREYAALYNTSGNQHATARLLAMGKDADLSDTVSALTPLGSHPYYEATT